MEKVKLICKSCGKENERIQKPEPKTASEKKQIYFICSCGAKNLRDGTAIFKKETPVTSKEPSGAPETPKAKERIKTDDPSSQTSQTPESPEAGFGFFRD